MKLKLKEKEFTVSVPPSERIMSGTEKTFWVLTFTLSVALTSDEVEELFTPENTEELTFSTILPSGAEYEYTISGYTNKSFCAIRRTEEGGCTVEIQLSKEAFASEG